LDPGTFSCRTSPACVGSTSGKKKNKCPTGNPEGSSAGGVWKRLLKKKKRGEGEQIPFFKPATTYGGKCPFGGSTKRSA